MRLMIYDKTALDDGFDLRQTNDSLTMSWVLGAKLYKGTRSVDHAKGVSSWAEALDWLNTFDGITQIQFWGHSGPGVASIGGEALSLRSRSHEDLGPKLMMLKTKLAPGAIWWFRSCALFCGTRGQEFAQGFAEHMNCKVAAHTHIIAMWHSGLHTISPGEAPSWPLTEGIELGTPDRIEKIKWSKPWYKHTIVCLRGSIPKGW